MRKAFIVQTGREKDIIADVSFDESKKNQPIVVFCHGYKGYKDWGAWNLIADKFAEMGFFFLKFNFSHNGGTLDNPIDFPDLNAFGNNTLSLEVEDLNSIINWVYNNNEFSEYLDVSNISLIGHSRGGAIATLVASQNKKISKVVSWAAVANFGSRFPKDENVIENWKSSGVVHVVNGRTKQQMPHYFSFYEDYIKNQENLNIIKATATIEVPHLIIHGDKDAAVSVNAAHRLAKANPNAKLEIIKEGDHTFGSKHPWEAKELPEKLLEIVNLSINFMKPSNKL